MKIKMLTSMAGEAFAFKPGDVVDREDAEAIRLIEKGYAVPCVDQPERAIRQPQEVRSKGRRGR
jgi:hypothetical protein